MRISRTRRTQPSRLGTLRVGAIFFGAWAATAIGSHALAQDASRLKPLPLTIKQVPVSVGHPHANPGAPAPRRKTPRGRRRKPMANARSSSVGGCMARRSITIDPTGR